MDDDGTNETSETEQPAAPEAGPETADEGGDEDVEGFYLDPNVIPPGSVSEQQTLVDVFPDPNVLLRTPNAKPPKYRKAGKHL